jgi:uncharacterized sulfatase
MSVSRSPLRRFAALLAVVCFTVALRDCFSSARLPAAFVSALLLVVVSTFAPPASRAQTSGDATAERPNVLLAISDDQSWPHASAYGTDWVRTPAFDRVAREGVLFENAFVDAPACSPSRAALLTGRHIWQIEQAGSHWSSFPQTYVAFPTLLAEAGYHTGFTGKGWGPGNWKVSGREHNPAGTAYNDSTAGVASGLSSTDYAANFAGFLEERSEGKAGSNGGERPFYFWYGSFAPHRPYGDSLWRQKGVDPSAVEIPGFLPDVPPVRNDIANYAAEVEHFDDHLGRMIALLKEKGELENTVVIVTSDNGMPFAGAKSTLYEYGTHVPLAVRWGNEVDGGRTTERLTNLIDLAPTILDAAGVDKPTEHPMAGKSLLPMLAEDDAGAAPSDAVFTGRERHGFSLWHNLSYPQRAVRTPRWLYIRNFKPERWPQESPLHRDPAASTPTRAYLLRHRDDPNVKPYFEHALGHRPAEQLFAVREDPANMTNLAGDPDYRAVQDSLRALLGAELMATDDPRVTGRGDVFERYPYYGPNDRHERPAWAADSTGLTVPSTTPKVAETAPRSGEPDAVEATIRPAPPSATDGSWKDAAFWTGAEAHAIDGTPGGGAAPSADDLSGRWQARWGEQHLYLRVVARDDRAPSDASGAPWNDDSVVLFFDGGNEKALQHYDQNDFQYGFPRGGDAVVTGTLSVLDTTGVAFTFEETEGGYLFEAALPWSTLNTTPQEGALVGMDVHLNDDDDGGGRDAKKTWHNTEGGSWNDPSTFGTVRLGGDEGPRGP